MKTEEPKAKRKPDVELQTIARIDRLLSGLSEEGAKRALALLNSRYGTPVIVNQSGPNGSE